MGFSENDHPFTRHTIPEGIEVVDWFDYSEKTLYDYEVIIADLSTAYASAIKPAKGKRDQLKEQLKLGGLVVVFTTSKKSFKITEDEVSTNYELLPPLITEYVDVVNEPSKRFSLVNPGDFKKIFNLYRGQGFYLALPYPASLRSKCGKFMVLARNRKGEPIGLQVPYEKGWVVLLPKVSPKKNALSVILEEIIPEFAGVPEPRWIVNHPFVDEKELLDRRDEIDKKLAEYRSWRGLLYATGTQLTNVVFKALSKMGVDVQKPEVEGIHDLEIDLSDNTIGITEITGSKKPIDLDKVRQLFDWCTTFEQGHPAVKVKGILIGNPEREKDLKDRGVPFTSKAVEKAKMNKFCLMTTAHLYHHLGSFYKGKLTGEQLVDLIRRTSGSLPTSRRKT